MPTVPATGTGETRMGNWLVGPPLDSSKLSPEILAGVNRPPRGGFGYEVGGKTYWKDDQGSSQRFPTANPKG